MVGFREESIAVRLSYKQRIKKRVESANRCLVVDEAARFVAFAFGKREVFGYIPPDEASRFVYENDKGTVPRWRDTVPLF